MRRRNINIAGRVRVASLDGAAGAAGAADAAIAVVVGLVEEQILIAEAAVCEPGVIDDLCCER